jgi:hypothetical protein
MTDYLAQHPHVGVCARKEQYFATDLYPKFVVERAIHGSVARATSAIRGGAGPQADRRGVLSGICIRWRRPARSTNSRRKRTPSSCSATRSKLFRLSILSSFSWASSL